MAVLYTVLSTSRSLSSHDILGVVRRYLAQMSPNWPQFGDLWADFVAWLSQPHIFAVVVAWAITFTVACTIIMCLGFGPAGIIPGTIAAAFQSWMYGGFTPAGGIFATLTSMAMLGFLMPAVCIGASVLATFVSVMVWVYGVGR